MLVIPLLGRWRLGGSWLNPAWENVGKTPISTNKLGVVVCNHGFSYMGSGG
jgi:hypothetical protein